jgi:hypothetical protein
MLPNGSRVGEQCSNGGRIMWMHKGDFSETCAIAPGDLHPPSAVAGALELFRLVPTCPKSARLSASSGQSLWMAVDTWNFPIPADGKASPHLPARRPGYMSYTVASATDHGARARSSNETCLQENALREIAGAGQHSWPHSTRVMLSG